MLKTFWATVREGKIELLESSELPEGTKVLVTVLPDKEAEFWLQASQTSLDTVWNNTEDSSELKEPIPTLTTLTSPLQKLSLQQETSSQLKKGNLSRLRGIAKTTETSGEDVETDYINYLTKKYQ
ncbi:hypothetical protein [Planktothrix paucivesiculata]|nr:hypothetical protein [Planktothrix paucivesiculata]